MPVGDASQVPAAIATALAVREAPGRPLLETLQASLRDQELLLLLDNFEQVVEAAPVIGALLASAPSLRVLVTSQVLMDLRGEHVFKVPPLNHPNLRRLPAVGADQIAFIEQHPAVQLFVRVHRLAQPALS